MKSNKGFTLIELLAVIVILAIIALIATPRILDVVEEARKGAAKSSILGYIDAVEKQAMINQLNANENDDIVAGTYSVEDLAATTGDHPYSVAVKGDEPKNAGTSVVVTDKGEVDKTSVFITKDGKYRVTYNDTKGEWVAESATAASANNANA